MPFRTVVRRAAAVLAVGIVGSAGAIAPVPEPAAAAVCSAGADDTVSTFGAACFFGSTSGKSLTGPVVGMAGTPSGAGYWIVSRDGGVFTFGDAQFHGSAGGIRLNAPIVGITAVPTGGGYWLFARDGGVFSYGSARFYGSTGNVRLNAPVIGMAATPDGKGYWLFARDGGVFTFGSARFYGSTGNVRLNAPVIGMAAVPSGGGYWLIASDGGVFTFGSARFYGSTGAYRLAKPVVGMAATSTGKGYWLASQDGGVYTFGDAPFYGALAGSLPQDRQVTQITGVGKGGYRLLTLPLPRDTVLLGPGASGPAVTAVQQHLTQLGYWLGAPNGQYGLLTTQAVTAFQKVHGLPRTGRVDVVTDQVLRTARRPYPRSTSGYVIEVDKARQVIFVARNGVAEWVINTSTGTEKPYVWEGHTYLADTPVGRFSVFKQIDGIREGELGRLYRPKYFHPDGIAFHGYSSVPPYPASHGCVRMTYAAIDWVWANNVIPLGTSVWVY